MRLEVRRESSSEARCFQRETNLLRISSQQRPALPVGGIRADQRRISLRPMLFDLARKQDEKRPAPGHAAERQHSRPQLRTRAKRTQEDFPRR